MAPIKFMGKRAAAQYFTRFIAWRIRNITGRIVQAGVNLLIRIGRSAFAAAFNLSAKAAISAIINEPMRFVTACMSVGGAIAAIWDYFSDRRFDGWIKLW